MTETRTGDELAPLTIVVGSDASDQAELALEQAFLLATKPRVIVHALGVVDREGHALMTGSAPPPDLQTEVAATHAAVSARVEKALAKLGRPGLRVFVHTQIGDPAEEILALASEVQAGLIIVGTHGRRGMSRFLLGSVAEKVMRKAQCPVLTMKPTTYAAASAKAEAETQPEPPCPACLARREETGGSQWWCDAHDHAWVKPHRYAYTDEGMTRLRPDEWVLW